MEKSKKFVSMLAVLIGLTFSMVTAIRAEEEDPAIHVEESLATEPFQEAMIYTNEGREIEAQSGSPGDVR